MAINGSGTNGLPASITNITEQTNFLETKLRKGMKPKFVFRHSVSKSVEYFEGRIGETKTFTRSAEIPPTVTPMNPANNSGLDNGITPSNRVFEQWQAQLYLWPGGVNINILGNETQLADLYLDDIEKLGGSAANSLELVCANRLMQAYDTGDTFATAAITGTSTSLSVDNIFGFDTQFPFITASPASYGLPSGVSSTNKLPILIIDQTTGLIKGSANVTAAIAVANTSYMNSAGIVNGQSGTLTLDAAVGPVVKGDRVVATDVSNTQTTTGQAFNPTFKDGSTVVRPLASGTPITTAFNMAVTNVVAPSIQIPMAVSILKRRNVPKLKNGLYGCAIDPTLLAQFYQDDNFLKATATRWEQSPVFTDGVIAAGWGVEFTDATQLPVYQAPAGGFALRHAFVFGEDVVAEHPFAAARNAQTRAAGIGDMFDFRWVDRIEFITQAALDRLGQVIKISYAYTGDFRAGTDKGSTPAIVQTTDYNRFKRGILVQASSPY